MSAARIVQLAVVAGGLVTTEATDSALAGMSPSRHHDPTWTELSDALLDQRNALMLARSLEKVLSL